MCQRWLLLRFHRRLKLRQTSRHLFLKILFIDGIFDSLSLWRRCFPVRGSYPRNRSSSSGPAHQEIVWYAPKIKIIHKSNIASVFTKYSVSDSPFQSSWGKSLWPRIRKFWKRGFEKLDPKEGCWTRKNKWNWWAKGDLGQFHYF